MNEFVEQFLLESRELVEQASADLLALEESPGNADRLDGAFRGFHTLKGSAGIVDFGAMAKAAHAAENVLAAVRSGTAEVSRQLISDCLHCLDVILRWLDAMQLDGEIPKDADLEADALVRRFADYSSDAAKQPVSVTPNIQPIGTLLSAASVALLQSQIELLQEGNGDGFLGRLLSAGRVTLGVLRSAGLDTKITDIERATAESAAAEDGQALLAAISRLLKGNGPSDIQTEPSAMPDASARVLRVDVERIDALVKLTGELTVAKNAVGHAAQIARSSVDPQTLAQLLKEQHATLERLIGELQRSVLAIRVLPLRHVFNRFPRLVRELAEALRKPAKLLSEGDDTEADKVVVENLFEPLLHIVRNALDHGIESAAERSAAGKPAVANIYLRAFRRGDFVLVEVEDDGRGVDIPRVRALAIERGIGEPAAIAALTDDEVVDLVFAPGFSTAAEVTDLSGRGVGMDVVRSSVERLGGTARIASRSGQGATVTLRLPFSVMMTSVMTVESGGQIFGLPLESVVETVRIPRSQISAIGKGQAFVLRNRTIPVLDLAGSIGAKVPKSREAEANIVVISVAGELGSLEVDRFGERLDVMLKPVDGLLQGMPGVSGTSLLGNGGVLIVLDLQDLLQ
jgi:two-component system chemotaxis sensor kinase CheA